MSNPPLPFPLIPDDADGADRDDRETPITREVDGQEVLDHDIDDNQVNSADADRIAVDPDEDA
jgi:hypothetical protein